MPVPRTLPSLPAPVDELRPDACGRPWLPGNCPQASATRNFRLADERRPFLNNEARRLQITLQSAARLKLTAFTHRDVALNFSINRDGLGFDLATDVRVLANGQDPIGIDLALHLPVDQKFLLKLD